MVGSFMLSAGLGHSVFPAESPLGNRALRYVTVGSENKQTTSSSLRHGCTLSYSKDKHILWHSVRKTYPASFSSIQYPP